MSDPDIDLILRVIAQDDRHAFGELVKRHQSAVRNHLRALTKGDRARADDLAQDTFIKAYRSIRQFQGTAKFSSWLYRIAYNTFLNDQRKSKPNVPYEDEHAKAPAPSRVRESDLGQDLEQALAHLKTEQAVVFDLHYKKGMTHAEIAQTLEMPLGTVKTHLARGLALVRDYLHDWKP